jgi:hypothetical protein
MGTNQDVQAEATKISITNHVSFAYDDLSTIKALKSEIAFRNRFYKEAKEGKMEEAKKGFYRKLDKEEGGA